MKIDNIEIRLEVLKLAARARAARGREIMMAARQRAKEVGE